MICGKNSIKWTMVKLLSVVVLLSTEHLWRFMSASSITGHCQHTCKHFALSVHLYWSTAYKTLLANQYWHYMPSNVTKAHILLYTAVHGLPFYSRNHKILLTLHFIIKQAVHLNGFASKQYWPTTALMKLFLNHDSNVFIYIIRYIST